MSTSQDEICLSCELYPACFQYLILCGRKLHEGNLKIRVKRYDKHFIFSRQIPTVAHDLTTAPSVLIPTSSTLEAH